VTKPEVTIVIPIYNEAAILETAVRSLVSHLNELQWSYELLLAQNGSTDGTREIADRLAEQFEFVTALHSESPNYGRALKLGISTAKGQYIICDEIDLGDTGFYTSALELLRNGTDMVVGSKRHPDSVDDRPWIRRKGTAVLNGMLRTSLGFEGTDTHGLKAFDRALIQLAKECVVEHDLFASELVIRAYRAGLDVQEIPLRLREIRPPSVGLIRRVPKALTNLAKLVYVIRISE
jgi:glycosyltransferase involved in cell wall biosynthesis